MQKNFNVWMPLLVYAFHTKTGPLAPPSYFSKYRVFWPGQTIDVCEMHRENLQRIARVLRFDVDFVSLILVEEKASVCINCVNELKRDLKIK